MKNFKNSRPEKRILSEKEQELIIEKAVILVKNNILSGDNIIKILLTGSAVQGLLGKYKKELDDKYSNSR